jgi:hypothetical protein
VTWLGFPGGAIPSAGISRWSLPFATPSGSSGGGGAGSGDGWFRVPRWLRIFRGRF